MYDLKKDRKLCIQYIMLKQTATISIVPPYLAAVFSYVFVMDFSEMLIFSHIDLIASFILKNKKKETK
jgi:hypothetical protein